MKVNDKFSYPLELDLSPYLDSSAQEEPENCLYELKAVLIHRGGTYGGHYHTYVFHFIDYYL